MSDRKLTLGNQAPFVGVRGHFAEWFRLDDNYRHWPKPYERFFTRLGYRRYSPGPRPWTPGRYATAMWQPYSGYGRFSGLRDTLAGAYHAERYTGERKRPEDYIRRHGSEEEYQRHIADTRRRRSWTLSR